jgi:hypothetical protein
MSNLNELIRSYCDILNEERALEERKHRLRDLILERMRSDNVAEIRSAHGSAQRMTRFKLLPRRDEVLGLLTGTDLFPFATFLPAKVKAILVPKYGRERLLPLFGIERTELLLIRRPRPDQDDMSLPQTSVPGGWRPPHDEDELDE